MGCALAVRTPFPGSTGGANTVENTVESILRMWLLSAAEALHALTLDGSTTQRMGLGTHVPAETCLLPSRKS